MNLEEAHNRGECDEKTCGFCAIEAAPASTPERWIGDNLTDESATLNGVKATRKVFAGEVAIPDTPPGVEWKPTIAGGSFTPDTPAPDTPDSECGELSTRIATALVNRVESCHALDIEQIRTVVLTEMFKFYRAVPAPAETQGKG